MFRLNGALSVMDTTPCLREDFLDVWSVIPHDRKSLVTTDWKFRPLVHNYLNHFLVYNGKLSWWYRVKKPFSYRKGVLKEVE